MDHAQESLDEDSSPYIFNSEVNSHESLIIQRRRAVCRGGSGQAVSLPTAVVPAQPVDACALLNRDCFVYLLRKKKLLCQTLARTVKGRAC
jgi:hypothetical protein